MMIPKNYLPRMSHEEVPDSTYPPHGGNRKAAAKWAGLKPDQIIDFSASIHPLGPPEGVKKFLKEGLRLIGEYPDPYSNEFKEILSQTLQVDREFFSVTNGSTELIYQLPHLMERGKGVLVVNPCFSEYEKAFRLANVPVHSVSLDPESGFRLDLDRFLFHLRALPDIQGIVIGNPNSPTGSLCAGETLLSLIQFCEKRKIFLFADETFIQFTDCEQFLLNKIKSSRFLILIRSMTKFFALPGLRLGYGIMHPEWVQLLETYQPPWSVNAMAQAAGSTILKDTDYPERVRTFVRRERRFLNRQLKEIKSLEVYPAEANFILFRLETQDESHADRLYRSLLSDGILLRNCGNFTGLDRNYFRVTVREREDNQLLISKLITALSLIEV